MKRIQSHFPLARIPGLETLWPGLGRNVSVISTAVFLLVVFGGNVRAQTRVFCPMYPTMPLEEGYLYYALECDQDAQGNCTTLNPTAMAGTFDAPLSCPNCIDALGARPTSESGVTTAARLSPPGLSDFPGYAGPIKPDSFDPTMAAPSEGGFPESTAWDRPTVVEVRRIKFLASRGTMFAKVFTVRIKPRAACAIQNLPACHSMPEYVVARIGYEVLPTARDDSRYTWVRAEPIAKKVARAYTGGAMNKRDSAVLILARTP